MASVDAVINITAGTGTPMKTLQVDSSTNHVQYTRELQADTVAPPGSWTITATGSASVIAADVSRVVIVLLNTSSVRVYWRYDSTLPTTANGGFHNYVEANALYEVPLSLCRLPISFIGASATSSGTLVYTLGTKA